MYVLTMKVIKMCKSNSLRRLIIAIYYWIPYSFVFWKS